jgi:diguanylate cyclase (GGDEF)-like protein
MPVEPRLDPRLGARPGSDERWSVLQSPAGAPPNGDGSRIRSLAVMARALGRSARLETTLEIAAEEAVRALDAACVAVSRLEPGTGDVRTIINAGVLGPGEERWPVDEVYRLEDYAKLATVVEELRGWHAAADDPRADPAEVDLMLRYGKGAALAVPLLVDGTLWGEFYASRMLGDRPFVDDDLAYTEALSAILAGAISRALREATLERLAYRDPLTGLPNRRALDEATGRIMPGQTVNLAIVDINGLKIVNDTLGHDEGDRVIREIGSILQRGCGTLPGALVARMGGDEFAVVAPGHPVERVRALLAAACEAADELPQKVGISCGLATSGPGRSSAEAMFRDADEAQYLAKRAGVSSVVVAGSAG